ncbi:uncharacterized protein STEHIDRAFT_78462 [Stereum hirsutum FP-91666 SS1]|uniref:uncharacterized protein n=1 Tax=Stereum hirsutum (strain FP-91666) TaxID=721885 RepID=UPI000440A7AC|nr:uncharacterized protein STEHIDRAFT_78462 [Stereum hirsutum FP-91666 SS1]EIM87499.1 hypothetical protein STEHIDRAFT_78462 [Stereum hirsutum FP-91666 SS1]
MFGYATALILAAAAPSALATVYVTAPVASTSWAAGSSVTLTWQEDGTTPSLGDFGPASIGIYVGNVNEQTLLQTISDSLDVSNATSIDFTPDASIGADSDAYFIRFQSISAMDDTSAYHVQAFSSKFTMTGMTGTFNATVLAEMSSTASGSASSTASSASASSTKAASTTKASTASTATASASSDSTSGAESRTIVNGVVGLAGLAAAGVAYFL